MSDLTPAEEVIRQYIGTYSQDPFQRLLAQFMGAGASRCDRGLASACDGSPPGCQQSHALERGVLGEGPGRGGSPALFPIPRDPYPGWSLGGQRPRSRRCLTLQGFGMDRIFLKLGPHAALGALFRRRGQGGLGWAGVFWRPISFCQTKAVPGGSVAGLRRAWRRVLMASPAATWLRWIEIGRASCRERV